MAGQANKDKKQQQAVGDMKYQIDQVVFAGIQTKKLAIEHMRYPGQWMPVRDIGEPKSPNNPVLRNAGPNHWVVDNIQAVIETDKLMLVYLPVNCKNGNRKPQAAD